MLQRKFRSLRNFIRDNYFVSAAERKFSAHYRRRATRGKPQNCAPLIVIQCVDNFFYYCLLAEIVGAIRNKTPIRVEMYMQRLFRAGSVNGWFMFLRNRVLTNLVTDWKWARLYYAYCDGIGFVAALPLAPWKEISNLIAAWSLWRKLHSIEQLATLKLRSVPVGDLVIDTYLRFKPSPAVNLRDIYLLVVLFRTLRILDRSFAYFERKSPRLYLTSYSTYVHHGVPVRVALALNIRVLSFGNFQEFCKEIVQSDLTHTKKGDDYSADFSALSAQPEKLAIAHQKLVERTTGVIDTATAYMRTSAYATQDVQVPEAHGCVVVFLHDFYDSAHIYKWILFHDFLEWTRFTLDYLIARKIPFFVKPHPNQIGDSGREFLRLKASYPEARFLSPKVSNKQLAETGIACAVTIYGTVASEMAFLGIPSISCGDSPHVSFGFGHTARSKDEYKALLSSYRELKRDAAELTQQACAFYYMHNLNLSDPERALRDGLVQMRKLVWYTTDPDPESVIGGFSDIAALPAFLTFNEKIVSELANKG